jgi:WD40 repeat protein
MRRNLSHGFTLALRQPVVASNTEIRAMVRSASLGCILGLIVSLAALGHSNAHADPLVIQPARVLQCAQAISERPTVVSGVVLTSDGRSVIAATDDHAVSVWETSTGELQRRYEGHADWVRALAIAPDARLLISGAHDRTVCLWDLAQHQRVAQLPISENAVAAVAFHGNGQQIAIVGFGGSMQIVNTSSGQVMQAYECAGVDQRAIVFSPDGERMAAAGRNGRIRVWNTLNGTPERDIDTDGRAVRALAFSPNSRQLAAAGDGTKIRIFDAATGQLKITFDSRPAKVFALVFTSEQQVASGGSDNRICLWDVTSGQQAAVLVGHTGTVTSLSTAANGGMLASGSFDTTVRIWNLNPGPQQVTAERNAIPVTR